MAAKLDRERDGDRANQLVERQDSAGRRILDGSDEVHGFLLEAIALTDAHDGQGQDEQRGNALIGERLAEKGQQLQWAQPSHEARNQTGYDHDGKRVSFEHEAHHDNHDADELQVLHE